MKTKASMPPVIDRRSRALILGTLPGDQSLRVGRYYANPTNQFWKLVYGLFDREPAVGYEERLKFLKSKRIALWDVLRESKREGSSDAAIRDGRPNDLEMLLESHPNIRCVAFNGGKAWKLFKEHFARLATTGKVELLRLPSTSGVPGRYVRPLDLKLESWAALLPNLTD